MYSKYPRLTTFAAQKQFENKIWTIPIHERATVLTLNGERRLSTSQTSVRILRKETLNDEKVSLQRKRLR